MKEIGDANLKSTHPTVNYPSTEAKPVEDAEGQGHVAEDGPDLEAEELHLGVVDVRLE